MSVVVVGLNHRTVPLEVLERMTVSDARLPKALHDLDGREDLSEALVLSTCMRTEIYAVAGRFHGAVVDIRNFLAEWSGTPPEAFADHLYSFYDGAAVAHLFKVASGIDSAVLGEGEILGQVREAWEGGRAEGTCGTVLGGLFRHALEVGKRARSETGIARGTTSLSQAAVAMAAERLGSLEGRRIMLLGTGDMGEGMAQALAASPGVADVLVANRSPNKAAALAARIGGRPVELSGFPAALEEVDLLLTSTGSPSVLLEASDVESVMAARAGRPLLIADIAVPRDVDSAVGEVPGVTLLDMDDLRAFAEAGIEGRRQEIARVQTIITEEVERYLGSVTEREVAPLVADLRSRAEVVRRAELERYRSKLAGLDDRQREAVEAMTRAVLNKFLHEPTIRLKESAGSPKGERLAEALRALFDL
ncbi:MAG: glutamyl-tRNA reductase [Acidimicrobiaceae bacterium]|nr:glutamyl-tRNA reductase [Acidimicrobiaceae bacterium]